MWFRVQKISVEGYENAGTNCYSNKILIAIIKAMKNNYDPTKETDQDGKRKSNR